MTNGFSWTSFAVSTVLALISFGFNLWQYHSYSKKIEGLRGSMSAWWHWVRGMYNHIQMYWEAAAKNPSPEVLSGIAKGTIDGLAKQTGRLAEDIGKTTVAMGFPPPWHESWRENKAEQRHGT